MGRIRLGVTATALLVITAGARADPACPADFNSDGEVNGNDVSDYINAWYADIVNTTALADFNGDGETNGNDISDYLNAWYAAIVCGGTCCPSNSITLTVSPTSGGLGTVVTLSISPAVAPNVFDANTTAEWTGVYRPMVGMASGIFTIAFNTTDLRETNPSQATILMGSGTVTALPAASILSVPGILDGVITVRFGSGGSATAGVRFVPVVESGLWYSIAYPDGYGGLDGAVLGLEPEYLNLLELLPFGVSAQPSVQQLESNIDTHYAVAVQIERNSLTLSIAPANIQVDVVSYDENGVEFFRVGHVSLSRFSNSTTSQFITYVSDLQIPIIPVDTSINAASYPGFRFLRVLSNGFSAIEPAR